MMKNIAVGIIVFIIIILITIKCRRESFTINTDISATGATKAIDENYTYSGCTGCLRYSDNKLKPKFSYNISDNRCVKNATVNYLDESSITNLNIYSDPVPNINLSTCEANYNSMYSSVNGRYIYIYHPLSTVIQFIHISVHARDTTVPALSNSISQIFAVDLAPVNAIYTFPEDTLSSGNSTVFRQPSFMVISLQTNTDIGYINIKHTDSTEASTMDGAKLLVLRDEPLRTSDARIVFSTTLRGSNINRIIYTYNYFDRTSTPDQYKPIINTWMLPCTNCQSKNGNLFKNHQYKMADLRCFKPKTDSVSASIFNSTITQAVMDASFETCDNGLDSRYEPSNGRFIRIYADGSLTIVKIRIYSNYNDGEHNLSNMPLLSALVKDYIDSTKLFSNAIDSDNSTVLQTKNGPTLISIDLGSNQPISGISLTLNNSSSGQLVGCKIFVISVNVGDFTGTSMRIKSSQDIDQTKVNTGIVSGSMYSLLIPLPINRDDLLTNNSDLDLFTTVNYDIANKYLTTYSKNGINYQIPYTIYNINGRNILAKTLRDTTILNEINSHNGNTLYNLSTNTDITNVPGNNTSHLLTPTTARYIQLTPNTSTDSIASLLSRLVVYNSSKTEIANFSNFTQLYETNHSTYARYLTTTVSSNPSYILLDIGTDNAIAFIKLILTNSTLSTALTLSLINNSFRKVSQYSLSSGASSPIIIATDWDIRSESNSFVAKYAYPNCTSFGMCNTIASDAYYILIDDEDRCFKAKSRITNCSDCMQRLPEFSKRNRIASVDNNFESCNPSIDTRFLPTYTVYYPFSNNDMSAGEGGSLVSLSTFNANGINSLFFDSSNMRNGKSTLRVKSGMVVADGPASSIQMSYLIISDISTKNIFTIAPNEEFTIQLYVKFNPVNNLWQSLLNFGDSFQDGILVRPKKNPDSFFAHNTSGSNITNLFQDNTWYHVCLVRNLDNETIEMYLNGSGTVSASVRCNNSYTLNPTNSTILIGASRHRNGEGMDGWISDFVFIKRATIKSKIYQ